MPDQDNNLNSDQNNLLTFPVVVVEDNRGLNDLIRLSLGRLKFKAESVYSGREAIERLMRDANCLVILDYFLGDMSGKDVVEKLRARGIRVQFISMTGQGDEKIAVEMMKMDARDYLIKDKEFHDQLPRVVRRAIQEIRTERRLAQAEAALRDGEERFRVMFETSQDLLAIGDDKAQTIWSNTAWQETMPANFISPDKHREVIHPDDYEKHKDDMRKLHEGIEETVSLEFRLRANHGRYIHLETTIRRINLSGKVHYFICAHDITDRKLNLQSLKESEKKYRDLIEQSLDAIFLIVNGHFEHVNKQFCEFFGVNRQDVLDSKIQFADLVAPISKSIIEDRIRLLGDQKTVSSCYEFTALTADKRQIEVEATETFFNYHGGTAQQGIIRDVSERKKLESHIQQATKMEAIGRMASGVAHDFNNLLTVIQGQTEIAMLKLGADDRVFNELTTVNDAAQTATALTTQLLAFSRKGEIMPQKVSLNEIIISLRKLLESILGVNIKLMTELQNDLWNVKVDKDQMKQVLINLATNARDVMDENGIFAITTRNMIIGSSVASKITGCPEGPYVLISVADNGCGMSEDVKSMIFEPFFTTKGEGKGTGLGLATVYGNVRRAGGHVTVDSAPDEGTTFKVFIPAIMEDKKLFLKKLNLEDVPVGHETIFLAEDDDAVRIVTRRTLELLGYEVFYADSGEKAIELCTHLEKPINLLITDVILPRMKGNELVKHCLQRLPRLKVLFMSGFKNQEALSKGFVGEGAHYLEKPFSPSDLAFKVREALDI